MSFYLFRLDGLRVIHRRGLVPDDDVVTFSVLVNQLDRGHATGLFPALVASENTIPATAAPPNNTFHCDRAWQIGPLEIGPGDLVHVIYSGTNISDQGLVSLSTQDLDKLELRLLSAALTAAAAALTGGVTLLGDAVAAALGALGDPVGWALGYSPQGPCNGPVFADAVPFSGSGLDQLPVVLLPQRVPLPKPAMPRYSEASFTRKYTDEATHDTNICGHVAETDVTFSVIRMSFISVRWAVPGRQSAGQFLAGLRQNGSGSPVSLKSALGLRP